jgi:SpoU rRNA methylase family enzyme
MSVFQFSISDIYISCLLIMLTANYQLNKNEHQIKYELNYIVESDQSDPYSKSQ